MCLHNKLLLLPLNLFWLKPAAAVHGIPPATPTTPPPPPPTPVLDDVLLNALRGLLKRNEFERPTLCVALEPLP